MQSLKCLHDVFLERVDVQASPMGRVGKGGDGLGWVGMGGEARVQVQVGVDVHASGFGHVQAAVQA